MYGCNIPQGSYIEGTMDEIPLFVLSGFVLLASLFACLIWFATLLLLSVFLLSNCVFFQNPHTYLYRLRFFVPNYAMLDHVTVHV